jgi:endonuclease G
MAANALRAGSPLAHQEREATMDVRSRFEQLLRETQAGRERVKRLIAAGKRALAEDDPGRARAFNARRWRRLSGRPGAEALQGDTIDLQGVAFLVEGAAIRRAVAYLEVNDPRGTELGTGFLIAPGVLMTNCHVIRDAEAARLTTVIFDRELDETGRPAATTSFTLDPDRLALFSPVEVLDFAVLALGRRIGGPADLAALGYCPLSDSPDRHRIGMNVNIIQHPRGEPKNIAIRNNPLVARTERSLLYETDTEPGSSGAPVFNDDWDLVALHHWGEPFLEQRDEDGRPIRTNVNEGVRISAIHRDLAARLATLPADQAALLRPALEATSPVAPAGRMLTRLPGGPPIPAAPQPASPPAEASAGTEVKTGQEQARTMTRIDAQDGTIRLSIPLEITLRLGNPALGTAETAPTEASAPQERPLLRRSEALRIDPDYAGRSGYDPRFIPGADLPLPVPNARLARQVAPLRADQPNAADGLLAYEHFSLKLHKTHRVAIFTATNIDGATYLDVDRDSGAVRGAEAETWFKDPRVSETFYLGQSFYSEWSHLFDRGHLTRRTDPTWGDAATAERANADTFHLTNCSPQHFRFNQSTRFWQGVERYVLEKGVLAADSARRISVFQGPIYDDARDLFADDVQIPSSFFKIVAWKGPSGVKAVGLVVDQVQLLQETRRRLSAPSGNAPVDVAQWRVPIVQIEKRTGLAFAEAIRGGDTINRSGQPQVGAEAAQPISRLEDILL